MPSGPMEGIRVERAVLIALDKLYAWDSALLDSDASEWSIAHRLAVYLEHELPGWNVDCEFNRQGLDRSIKREATGQRVRPDIVVHHRGRPDQEHNLLAVELKKTMSEEDNSKAREYTAPPAGTRIFQYQFGLTLVLDGTRQLRWFREGRECKRPAA